MSSKVQNVLALIIDFNGLEDSQKLSCQLASHPQNKFGLTVVHVDNGNPSPRRLTAEQERLGVKLLRIANNDGYAAGLIGGIQAFDGKGKSDTLTFDAYWFLNSDLEAEPDCIEKLVRVLDGNPNVGASGPVAFHGRTKKVWGARGVVNPWLGLTAMTDWKTSGPLPKWSYIPGCSVLVRKTHYDSVGGLPDRYRMYYEETHLCIQLQKNGYDLWVEPSAVVYHMVHSMKASIPARHYAFYFARNNMYFWWANFGIPGMVQFPRTLFVVFKELLLPLRKAKKSEDFFDRLKFILSGVWDGFEFLRHRHTRLEKKLFQVGES